MRHKRWLLVGAGLLALATASMSTGLSAAPKLAETSGSALRVSGFTVRITGANAQEAADTGWQSLSGGALVTEVGQETFGAEQFSQATLAQRLVSELKLQGTMLGPVAGGGGAARERLSNGRFVVDIDGLSDFSDNVNSIDIGSMTIAAIETTTGADISHRTYRPGQPIYGNVSITAVRLAGQASEARQWYTDAGEGQNLRRNIEVHLLDSRGAVARSYALTECLPVQFSPFTSLGAAGVLTETLIVKCQRIEFGTSAGRRDLAIWLNDTIRGEDLRRDVDVALLGTQGQEVARYRYINVFPIGYVFPKLTLADDGDAVEGVVLKAERIDFE